MPYRFDFDVTHQVLRGQLEGQVTDEELVKFYKELARECKRIRPRVGIVDCSAVSAMNVMARTVRDLAKLPPAVPGAHKPRFVVAPAPSVFGLARMFQFEGEVTRPNLHVVHSFQEVQAVLGVYQLQFEPMRTE